MLTLAIAPWVVSMLVALFLFACVVLILTVLIQRPQGGGLSGAFGAGGGAGQTAFGTKTGDALTYATIGLFITFLGLAIGLNFVTRPSSITPTTATAAPAPGAGATTTTDDPANDGETGESATDGETAPAQTDAVDLIVPPTEGGTPDDGAAAEAPAEDAPAPDASDDGAAGDSEPGDG